MKDLEFKRTKKLRFVPRAGTSLVPKRILQQWWKRRDPDNEHSLGEWRDVPVEQERSGST